MTTPTCSSIDCLKNVHNWRGANVVEEEDGLVYEWYDPDRYSDATAVALLVGMAMTSDEEEAVRAQWQHDLTADGDVEENPGPRAGKEDTHLHRGTGREVTRRAMGADQAAARRARNIAGRKIAHEADPSAGAAEQRVQYARSGGEENPGPALLIRGLSFVVWAVSVWFIVSGVGNVITFQAVSSLRSAYPTNFSCLRNESFDRLSSIARCINNTPRSCARALWIVHVVVRHESGMLTLCNEAPDVYCSSPRYWDVVRQVMACHYHRYLDEHRVGLDTWIDSLNVHVGTRGAQGVYRRAKQWYRALSSRLEVLARLMMEGVEPNPGPSFGGSTSGSETSSRCVTADLGETDDFVTMADCPNQGQTFYMTLEDMHHERSTSDVDVRRSKKRDGVKAAYYFRCQTCNEPLAERYEQGKVRLYHGHACASDVPPPRAPPSTPEHCDLPKAAAPPPPNSRPHTPMPQVSAPVTVENVRKSLAALGEVVDAGGHHPPPARAVEGQRACGASVHESKAPEPERKALTGVIVSDRDLVRVARKSSALLSAFPILAADVRTRLSTIPYHGDDRLVTLRGVRVVPQAYDVVYCTVTVPVSTVWVSSVLTFVMWITFHWLLALPFVAYSAAMVSLHLNPVRFGYVPHLASCVMAEFCHAYRGEEIRSAVHMRLARVACFPLRDEYALSLLRGTEHVCVQLMASSQYFPDGGEPLQSEERDTDALAALAVPALLAVMAILIALTARYTPSGPVFPSSLL